MNSVLKTSVEITKGHLAALFASALFAVGIAATPMTACAQVSRPANTSQTLNHISTKPSPSVAFSPVSESELAKLDALPAAGRSYISTTLGADTPAYHVDNRGAGFHADSRGLDSDFTARGVEISHDSAHVRLALDAYGHGDSLIKVNSASATHVSPNRVEYHRRGITEWYENGPLGLEQGFTVEQPEKNSSGLLTVALAIDGNMTAKVTYDGKSATMSDPKSKNQFEYAGLVASDADGKELPCRLELASGRLLIKVEDGKAHYPVTIDPWVYQKTFSFNHPYYDAGVSVAVDHKSGTDYVVVVGAIYAYQPKKTGSQQSGVAYVFESHGGPWRMMTVYPSDGQMGDWFGFSVSIDNNPYSLTEGKTIVVGAPKHLVNGNSAAGKAYVFVKPANFGGWWSPNPYIYSTTETAGLLSGNPGANFDFGFSASVQSNTAVVGEPQPKPCTTGPCVGAAYVYQPSAGIWGPVTNQLPTPTLPAYSEFGFSVSHSNGPGSLGIAIVGAPQPPGWGGCAPCGNGYAYVFSPAGASWSGTINGLALTNPNNSQDWFGFSVSSATGYLAVVGAPNATCPTGAGQCPSGYPANTGLAWEYESNNGWTNPAAIYPFDGGTGDLFGYSVATDGKGGDCLAVGAPLHGGGQGEGYLWTTRYWGQGGYHDAGSQNFTNSSYGEFGWSAACYYGGSPGSAVFGAPVTNTYSGAAYLYNE